MKLARDNDLIRLKDPMNIVGQAPPDLTREQVIKNLHELITALDRRVPRLERTGEAGIARNAAALRREAVERIAELEVELVTADLAARGASQL
jgi:hypothetical protein